MLAELLVPGLVVVFLGLGAMLVALGRWLNLLAGEISSFTAWFIISLALVAGVMLLRSAEVPSLASRGFILSTSTISQNLDQGLTIAYKKLAVSARDVGNSTVRSVSSAASQFKTEPGQ